MALLLGGALLAGCGQSTDDNGSVSRMAGAAGSAADDDELNDAAQPAAGSAALDMLTRVRVPLGFGATEEMRAQVTDPDGAPLENVPVSFALMGRPQDASLANVEVLTNQDGIAANTLVAGEMLAAFRVRVSAPGADPVYVEVSVSNSGFGTLTVDAPYEGRRAVTERQIYALADMSCEEAERMAGDPMVTLDAYSEMPARFVALPAGASYAVLASAVGQDDVVLAQGCIDQVVLTMNADIDVSLSFQDEPLVTDGRFSLDAQLDTHEAAQALVKALRDGADASVLASAPDRSAGEAEAAFLLDTLDSTLRSDEFAKQPGMLELADAVAQARTDLSTSDAPENTLRALLELNDEGPLSVSPRLSQLVTPRLSSLALTGELELSEDTASLTPQSLSTLPTDNDTQPLMVALSEGGAVDGELSFDVDTDRVAVSQLRLPARLGALGVEAARAALSSGPGGYGDEIRGLAGCATLTEWLQKQPFDNGACDGACIDAVCERVAARLESAVDTALLALDAQRPVLELQVDFESRDEDGDLHIEQLDSDELQASWQSDDTQDPSEQPAAEPIELTGTVTAQAQGLDAGPVTQ